MQSPQRAIQSGMTNSSVDEETPLLSSQPTKLPKKQWSAKFTRQVTILFFMQLCEPIAGLSMYPYINQLIRELGITGGDDRKVGYYVGLVGSVFFATEMLTVLHWGRLSDRIGRKPVLLIGLSGSFVSMLCFGLSKTFWMLMVSRCLCGLLNGNIGVMKSAIGELTDSTNRADVVAWMPVIWSTGSAIGALIGGTFAKPAERFPTVFTSQFWKDYAYFLPCLVVACVVLVGIVVGASFLEEPSQTHRRKVTSSETTLTDDIDTDTKPSRLSDVLVYPVVLSVLNSVALAFLNIAASSLLALFYAMPVEIGGLGFSPRTIGYISGCQGVFNATCNILFFAKLVRRFGPKRVFCTGMTTYILVFLMMPIMNICARQWGVGGLVRALIVMLVPILTISGMPFGSIFIYITASAPNKNSLGATNGFCQMAVSFARTIGPGLSTAMFSYSVEHQILRGYGVYAFMITLTLMALFLAAKLPAEPWKAEGDSVQGEDHGSTENEERGS